MTRPLAEVERALALRAEGVGASTISRVLGIPRRTVQDWLRDGIRAVDRPKLSGADCHGACQPWEEIDQSNYSYLLGMYLGDGYIVRMGNAYRLRVYCDLKYPRIIEEVGAAMERTLPNRIGHAPQEGCVAVSSYSCHWPCFFPQHGPGMKHERPIVLAGWQQEIVELKPRPFVRGLIHSDGWRGNNVAIRRKEETIERRIYTRYQFSNRSNDIREMFCWALDLISVHWTQSNEWTISVSRRKDVHYLDSFVGPKR